MIAVLVGGNAAEREVSLDSGEAVYQALKNQQVACFKFDWHGDNLEQLWSMEFDQVFIVVHGRGGEDGVIQKALEQRGIAYTGSDSKSSKIGMDKAASRDLWSKHNLPLAPALLANKHEPIPEIDFDLPWAVKPTQEGSSIGISKVTQASDLSAALNEAWRYDDNALVERWIEGEEYTVAILDNQALPAIRIVAEGEFYNFESKYLSEQTQYLCPAGLSTEKEQQLQALALEAFKVLGAKGWGRVDFILDQAQNPYLLEINTVPGMTSHSLVPMAASANGLSFEQLVLKILDA